jgi:ABC-type multidrug transport system fused ATPase/permease subunit
VVEVGSHAELVAAAGAYAELVAIQQYGYRA